MYILNRFMENRAQIPGRLPLKLFRIFQLVIVDRVKGVPISLIPTVLIAFILRVRRARSEVRLPPHFNLTIISYFVLQRTLFPINFWYYKFVNYNIFETSQMDQEVPQQIQSQTHEYVHSTTKNEYKVILTHSGVSLTVKLSEKYTLAEWKNSFKKESVEEITRKTGHELSYNKYVEVLNRALSQRDVDCYIDVLTSDDLENLKSRKNGGSNTKKPSSASSLTKRYIILTYMTNQNKFHYPLSLTPQKIEPPIPDLKQIYNNLRMELEAARASALNDTQKSESFSINYNDKKSKNNPALNPNKIKEIDQHKSENQILKAKLNRLEEQVQKKKANIEIEAAIERAKLLKQNIETANLELVDWKNNIQEQEEDQMELKRQLAQLHKKICSLLQTEKEVAAKKKGDETEKQLNQVKNAMKKNTNELDKLKNQLEVSKAKAKELEIKAKKLNSEKQVIKKGRRGPYSSAGSVRSYGSYGSSKRSMGGNSNASSNSSAGKKSNYSSNSYTYGRR